MRSMLLLGMLSSAVSVDAEDTPARARQATSNLERLTRAPVAIDRGNDVYVGWRLLGTDPDGVAFDVLRDGVKVNGEPIIETTDFVDEDGDADSVYTIVPRFEGRAFERETATVWSRPVLEIPLDVPRGGTSPDGRAYSYSPNDGSVGDLDGDGEYEIVLKWDPSNAKDNSQSGYTGNVYLDAYELSGHRLWRIDLGRNVRAGAHYSPFLVYDLDGDGRAEVACRTADGTRDGYGKVIGDGEADHRNRAGYVLEGPEFLTVFDGETGGELHSVPYVPARGRVAAWGDDYGNRVDRFLACVAYLDGERPSLVFARGCYTRVVLAAFDWREERLEKRWVFDSDDGTPGNRAYRGQGAHSLTVGDVDGDGRDEIVYGAATIDDDGTGLYSTGLGHGDALHLGDFDPERPGLEVFMVHESPRAYGRHGVEMHAAEDGRILWSRDGGGSDVGRGVAIDVDPRFPGAESWASRGGFNTAAGQPIPQRPPRSTNFAIWWDGDRQREILDREFVDKWDHETGRTRRLLTGSDFGARSNNGTKATPVLTSDLLGDWREEVIWRHRDNDRLLVFTTTIPAESRLVTLMHDRQYRLAVAWQNAGYNQPPHPGIAIGMGGEAEE